MPTRRAVMHPLFYYSAFLLLFFFYCVTLANAVYAQKAPRGDVAPIQFADVTAASGITFEHAVSSEKKYLYESMSGGVLLFDYDQDGWLDIYFTNAQSVAMTLAGQKAKGALYHNNHDGTFTDVTDKAGVGYPCSAMGGAVGAGGLGQIGYQYGYVGYDIVVMNTVLILLVGLVFFIQWIGQTIARKVDHRK